MNSKSKKLKKEFKDILEELDSSHNVDVNLVNIYYRRGYVSLEESDTIEGFYAHTLISLINEILDIDYEERKKLRF